MKRYLIPLALVLPILAACTPQQQQQTAECGLSLYAANVTSASELIMAAQATPACMALGMDLMQRAVLKVMVERGIK